METATFGRFDVDAKLVLNGVLLAEVDKVVRGSLPVKQPLLLSRGEGGRCRFCCCCSSLDAGDSSRQEGVCTGTGAMVLRPWLPPLSVMTLLPETFAADIV